MLLLGLLLAAAQEARPPEGALLVDGGARATRSRTLDVRIRVLHPGAGGLRMSLSLDEKAAPLWIPLQERVAVELPPGDGEKTLRLRLRDQAGTESAPATAVIVLDTAPPAGKVVMPDKVAGSEARVVFDVPDAVAVQHSESNGIWSAWSAYATPRVVGLSAGSGPKTLYFRFRDEAGNESEPVKAATEAGMPSPPPAPAAELRALAVVTGTRWRDKLNVILQVDAAGMKDVRVEVDGIERLARRGFTDRLDVELPYAPGPHRLAATLWDGTGAEHRGEAVFQDAAARPDGDPEQLSYGRADRGLWSVGLMLGGVIGGLKLDSSTTAGLRDIEGDGMAIARAELRMAPVYPLEFGVAGELSTGEDVRVFSFGADAAAMFDLGALVGLELEGGMEAGVYYSMLDVDISGFGDFQESVLLRGGPRLRVRLGESIWADLLIDFRWAAYEQEEEVLGGDRAADLVGFGLWAGLSWRF